MAVTAHLYDTYLGALANKGVNVGSDSIYCALCTSSYTPNQGTDQFWSTPQAAEVSGTGYTAGGVALASQSWTLNTTTNVWTFTAANTSWTGATFTAAKAVLYDFTSGTTAATRQLVGFVDFGGNQAPSNQTLTITWNASGIFTVTVS